MVDGYLIVVPLRDIDQRDKTVTETEMGDGKRNYRDILWRTLAKLGLPPIQLSGHQRQYLDEIFISVFNTHFLECDMQHQFFCTFIAAPE